MPSGLFVTYDKKPTQFLISQRTNCGFNEPFAILLDTTDVPAFVVFDLRSEEDWGWDIDGVLFSDIRVDLDAGVPFAAGQPGEVGFIHRWSGAPTFMCCGEDGEVISVAAPPALEKRWIRCTPNSTHLRHWLLSKQPDGTTLTLFEAPSQPSLLAKYSWHESKLFGGLGCEPMPLR